MWQRSSAILLMPLAACSLVLGINDVEINDAGPSTAHYDGIHYGYVVDRAFIPTTQLQAQQYGLDLGSATSSKLDGMADNSFGTTLAILSAQGFHIQQKVDSLIDHASLIHLIDLQTADLVNDNNVGLTIRTGQNPIPVACSGPNDSVCRRHLTGTGMFSISFDSPTAATFSSRISNNILNGNADSITIQITFDGNTLLDLELLHARILATSIFDVGMTATIGGLITKTDLITKIVPVIQAQLKVLVDEDCFIFSRSPPNCNCASDSVGANLIKTFDGDVTNGADRDCQISTAEVLHYASLDSCSKESCTAADSISVGLKVEAIKATFPF